MSHVFVDLGISQEVEEAGLPTWQQVTDFELQNVCSKNYG